MELFTLPLMGGKKDAPVAAGKIVFRTTSDPEHLEVEMFVYSYHDLLNGHYRTSSYGRYLIRKDMIDPMLLHLCGVEEKEAMEESLKTFNTISEGN